MKVKVESLQEYYYQWMNYFRDRSCLWKLSAKNHRERYHECHDSYMRLCDIYDSTKKAEALAASRLELAKVVDRHRKDRMHSDMKLGWEMAKEILAQAKELGDG